MEISRKNFNASCKSGVDMLLLSDKTFKILSISSLSAPSIFNLFRKLCNVRPVRGMAQVTSKDGFNANKEGKIKSLWYEKLL